MFLSVTQFSFVKGSRADTLGNIQFASTTRNFNIPMACAGKVSFQISF